MNKHNVINKQFGLAILVMLLVQINPASLQAGEFILTEEPLSKVDDKITEESEVIITYNSRILSDINVSFDLEKGANPENIINRAVAENSLQCKQLANKYYIIFNKERDFKRNIGNKMLSHPLQTIRGTVTEEDGTPLVGVNILEVGTDNGTISELDGSYELDVNEGASLSFSYTGFQTQIIDVGLETTINVTMIGGALLDEVVVIGYGTLKKSDLTGAVASVSARDFDLQPLTRVDQALRGRAAGVAVTQNSGAPGAGYKIRIRGANSISGNNAPLYVVDGLVVGDINSLNINDIGSMEVLKDASATAIYGSRGANGVVLITTKTGANGPAKVEFETFFGNSKVIQKLPMMTPAEFAEGVNAAEGTEFYSAQEISALANGGEDWQDRFFRKANFNNAQLSVSGGSDAVDYYISGNIYNSEGTVLDQKYARYTFRANLGANISDKIKVGVNTFFSRDENEGTRANLATGITWDPTTPAFDAEGNYNFTPLKPGVGNGAPNPLVAPENNVRENFDHQIIANGYFDYKILDNLTLNVSAGLEQLNIAQNGYVSLLVNNLGTATVLNRDINRYQNTNRLTYTWDDSGPHRLQIDAIHEQQLVTRATSTATSSGFFSDNTTYKDLSLGTIQRTSNNSNSESLQSLLGRINYSLFDKLLLTATIRADGSSKFQEGNRWGVFPSGSIAYRLSEESFIKNSQTIDNLKVRLGFGITGSQAIAPLATRSIPSINPNVNYPFGGTSATIGVAPSNQLANPDLTWETTKQINAGFDLGLWSSKVTLSLDVYKKNTTDLLLNRILPSFVGPTIVVENVGEVENQGVDIGLGLVLMDREDWHISSNFNLSRNANKVVELVDGKPLELGNIYYTNTFPVNPTRVEVGLPISTFRGYLFEGVYQQNEADLAATFGRNPGDAKYRDVNGDGVISSDDIVTVGDGNPNFTWGWNWNINYRKLDLNFMLLGSQGNDIYNFQRMRMMGLGAAQFHAVHEDYKNRWTPSNPSNIPAGRNGTEFLSSQFIEDGSYMTLKNIVLGYTISNVLNEIGLSALRIYINAENLLILTGYTGFDPETTASGNSDVDLGIDLNTYPLSRSISFGVRASF